VMGERPSFDFSMSPAGFCREAGDLPERLSGVVKKDKSAWRVQLTAQGAETHVVARTLIEPDSPSVLVNVTGEQVDVKALAGWISTITPLVRRSAPDVPVTSASRPRALTVKVNVASATYDYVHASNVAFTLHRDTHSVFQFDPLGMDIWKGRIEGTARIREKTLSLDMRARDLSLASLNEIISSTAQFRGILSMHVTGSMPVGTRPAETFSGEGELWVREFDLEKAPSVVLVLTSVNFDKVIRRMKGQKKDPFPEAIGHGQFRLNRGVAHVSKLVLENRLMKLAYTGEMNYLKRTLNGRVVVQALTAIDQIVNDIPLARDVFLGDEKSFLPLWATLEGPWGNPTVRAEPVRNVTTPVVDIFKRIFGLPQKAIDKIRGKT
jgi:hypothetical protein